MTEKKPMYRKDLTEEQNKKLVLINKLFKRVGEKAGWEILEKMKQDKDKENKE